MNNRQNLSTYGAYNVRLELTDSNGIRRETLRPYLAIDRDTNPAWDASPRKNEDKDRLRKARVAI